MQELVPLPGATYTEALGVNNFGNVVGTSGNSQIRHAVLWSSAGEIEDLGVLPNDASSAANAINDAAEVVGASVGPYGSRVFIWTRAQGMHDLGALAGMSETEALAINKGGDVVGTSGDKVNVRAFVWSRTAGIQDLNALVTKNFPVVLEGGFGINDQGQIIAIGNVMNMPGQNRTGAQVHHSSPIRMFVLTPE
jgi:probable HAF family extracellular repeat protein